MGCFIIIPHHAQRGPRGLAEFSFDAPSGGPVKTGVDTQHTLDVKLETSERGQAQIVIVRASSSVDMDGRGRNTTPGDT